MGLGEIQKFKSFAKRYLPERRVSLLLLGAKEHKIAIYHTPRYNVHTIKQRRSCMLYEIIIGVIVNVLTVIITSGMTVFIAYIPFLVRRLRFMKDIRRFLVPEKRVLLFKDLPTSLKSNNPRFNVNYNTPFRNVYNEEEIKQLVQTDRKKNLFNGDCVRLDSIQHNSFSVSEVHFFDFLTTNLTYKPASKNLKTFRGEIHSLLLDKDYRTHKLLEHRIKARINSNGKPKTAEETLAINELANVITVSILLEDTDGNYLLVKRGNKVAISSGNFATTAAGSLTLDDLKETNPFIACGQRELKEELDLDVTLEVTDVVISKQKLQPAVLLQGKVNTTFKNLKDRMIAAPDFKEENTALFSVPKSDIAVLVRHLQFTDVAAYQLIKATTKKYSAPRWLFSFRKCDIRKWQL